MAWRNALSSSATRMRADVRFGSRLIGVTPTDAVLLQADATGDQNPGQMETPGTRRIALNVVFLASKQRRTGSPDRVFVCNIKALRNPQQRQQEQNMIFAASNGQIPHKKHSRGRPGSPLLVSASSSDKLPLLFLSATGSPNGSCVYSQSAVWLAGVSGFHRSFARSVLHCRL